MYINENSKTSQIYTDTHNVKEMIKYRNEYVYSIWYSEPNKVTLTDFLITFDIENTTQYENPVTPKWATM